MIASTKESHPVGIGIGPPIISELPHGSCSALAALLPKCRPGIEWH